MPRHRVLTPLRWSDMDAYGHVNNVQFLRLLEEARVQALSARDAHGGGILGTGLLVARAEIEYLEPLHFTTTPVAVDLWVTRIGAADFDFGYEVLDAEPSESADGGVPACLVYARAETTLVVYDLAASRARRMTGSERTLLEGWADGTAVSWRRRGGRR